MAYPYYVENSIAAGTWGTKVIQAPLLLAHMEVGEGGSEPGLLDSVAIVEDQGDRLPGEHNKKLLLLSCHFSVRGQ